MGATDGDEADHEHSWSYSTTSPTCTSNGFKKSTCSECGESEYTTIPALGHDWDNWKDLGGTHRRDCSRCGHYEEENHNSAKAVDIGDINLHECYCDKCNHFMFLFAHSWTGGESSPHTCTECTYVNTTHPYHMYNASNGGLLDPSLSYSCILPDGQSCPKTLTVSAPSALNGMDIDEYAASDATAKMGTVPEFPKGTYDFVFDGTLRDTEGNVITSFNMPDYFVQLTGWTQKNVITHSSLGQYKTYSEAQRSADLINAAVSYEDYVAQNGATSYDDYLNDAYASTYLVTTYTNAIENGKVSDWPDMMAGSAGEMIKNGNTYLPNVTFQSGGNSKFTVDYFPGGGGWMFWSSPFFPVDQLYKVGSYQKQAPTPIYANVYYCYRTLDNEIPDNGYMSMYIHSSIVTYNSGHSTKTVYVSPDMKKIDNTGYRYVGHSVSVGSIGGVGVSKAPPRSSSDSASVTVSSWANQSAAIVTFFVEPVKLSYGHKATNYVGNVIDINFAEGSGYEGTGLEFPDYFDEAEGRCYIPVSTDFDEDVIEPLESLHKFYWPGYILESSKVYEADTNLRTLINEKTYDEDETTNIDGDPPRYVVNERVPSFYESEKDGYAVDKEFYYYYNTPTIEIEHKKYDNPDEYMKSTDGNDIKYVQQIINEFAYIESLITDNVKEEYTLSASLAEGGTATFTYKYPTHDLVQVKIYEVTDSGYKHWATLYENERYNEGPKTYQIENYDGVFGDYYSESLNAIAEQLGQNNKLFNTNKNWKVEFIYDEVEKVHIKFKDLKGNSIFIKDPEGSGRYVGELIYEIPSEGYSYTPEETLGENGRYKLVKGTKSNINYDVEAETIDMTGGASTVHAEPYCGNWYIVIYYTNGKSLLVQYRDTENNDIRAQDTLELPTTGALVKVPSITLYNVKEYFIDTNYDGKGYNVTSGDTILYNTLSGDSVIGPVPLTEADTQISVMNPNETNQRMIIYYEKSQGDSKVIVEYREDIPEKPEIKEKTELNIPSDKETSIYVPDIPGYTPVDYDKDGTTDLPIPGDNTIEVIGNRNPDNPIKIIIWYVKDATPPTDPTTPPTDPDIPTIITPEDNIERIFLNANAKGSEEYEVIAAIPTSEDLYVSGDLYSYRFVSEIEKKAIEKPINIQIKQEYYTALGAGGTVGETDEIVVDITDYNFVYNYYDIIKAELYDLTGLHLENEAIKYYGNGTYTEGKADYNVNDGEPYIFWEIPEDKIALSADGGDTGTRVQLVSTPGYEISYNSSSNTITIKLTDIDYYGEEGVDEEIVEAKKNQLKNEAAAIIEKCTKIKVPKLSICKDGTDEVVILTGERYNLVEKGTALDSTAYYIPYIPGRAPLYSFFYDKDLYVREGAQNKLYPTQMKGNYKLIQEIEPETEVVNSSTDGRQLAVEPVNANGINIHTPIINGVTLTVDESDIQLAGTVSVPSGATVINLEQEFTIKIDNSGNHLSNKGYGNNKAYNHGGLTANGAENDSSTTSRIEPKSNDELMPSGIIVNTESGAVIDQSKIDTEQDSKGPSFAEYKLIRFPYDVYLKNAEGGPVLLKANNWYNLYAYVKPSVTEYVFVIPTWVTDAKAYTGGNGIQVLIVAENATILQIENAMSNPMSVSNATNNTAQKNSRYILRSTFDTYVAGRLYDLEIRDSDDPGYMGKVKPALKGDTTNPSTKEMPIAQSEQVLGYRYGLKLGYRFYFDLKTKGISNKEVSIKPNIYYVSQDGATKTDDISLFYHSKTNMYNKLSESDLAVRMTMAGTHGQVNNPDYTKETILAKQLVPSRVFTAQSIIGTLNGELKLKQNTEKLPYTKLDALLTAVGIDEAKLTTDVTSVGLDLNKVKDATGHWYGEYYLPSTTIVVEGAGTEREKVLKGQVKPITTGYLVVVFEEITTEDSLNEGDGYLTYDAPASETQWSDEAIDLDIILPNNKPVTLTAAKGAPMAIYQVGLRANNDFETEGTH